MRISTTSLIRRYIHSLKAGQPFSTRDCLGYGLRAAVNQALHRMVKDCWIVRLARGIFMKLGPSIKMPSVCAIAKTKARAFEKVLAVHGHDAANALKLLSSKNEGPTYAVSGHSTSFLSGHGRIHFVGVSPRQLKASDGSIGLIIRALKFWGAKRFDQSMLAQTVYDLNRTERQELRSSYSLMPSWMSDAYVRFWQ